MKLVSINIDNLTECHDINENNIPEVGSKSLSEFKSIVANSDFNLCISIDEVTVGFVICFKDSFLSTVNSCKGFDWVLF